MFVGAASRDVDDADPRGWRLGGGVTYGALAAARLGACVRALIGVDDAAAGAWELDLLRAAGAAIELVPLAAGPVFHNIDSPPGRVQVCHGLSDPVDPRALPASWHAPDAAVLAPVAGELGTSWADAFAPSIVVALGWQGLLRRCVAGERVQPLPVRPQALISRADLNVASLEDVRAGGAPLVEVLTRHGQQLMLTAGPRPALHLRRDGDRLKGRLAPAFPVAQLGDQTGAGDVLLAAWSAGIAAARLAGRAIDDWRLLALAMAAGSVKVEASSSLSTMPSALAVARRLRRPASPAA